jgi:hypothetical protein
MRWFFAVLLIFAPLQVCAQMTMTMGGPVDNLRDNVLRHTGSGTSLEPDSQAPPMLMHMSGAWMEMLHGEAAVVEQQQSGPRGGDKLFSVNWAMPMVQRATASGELTLRAMFSLEPATISGRFYPELFQEGETAFGKPIVDGQHPHNLFMELAAIYDRKLGGQGLFTLYAAPVGDPALGPTAFPHRASAEADPLAPLAHHLQDSTHIADEVLTGGFTWRRVRVEASGFHGREPDENRWHMEVGGLDSWSARLTTAPGRDWIAQYSAGHLHSPEALHAEEDVLRQTASIGYHHAFGMATIDAIAVWGRNHSIGSPIDANGYLAEATVHPGKRQTAWTRIENDDRTTDLLGDSAPVVEADAGRVFAATGGYAHQIYENRWSRAELGAQVTAYRTPARLAALYGSDPVGVAAVLHWQIGR